MAGSSVTQTVVTNIRNTKSTPSWIEVTLACVSDDTNGTVPSQTLPNLEDYLLISMRPVPDAVAPPTSAFEVRMENSDGKSLFLSGSIAVDSEAVIGGHAGSDDGNYPRMDSASVFKIVDPADSTTLLDIGNSKEMDVIARYERI